VSSCAPHHPVYISGDGANIAKIVEGSAFEHAFASPARVVAVDDTHITSTADWARVLRRLADPLEPDTGYCSSHAVSEDTTCCHSSHSDEKPAGDNVCFKVVAVGGDERVTCASPKLTAAVGRPRCLSHIDCGFNVDTVHCLIPQPLDGRLITLDVDTHPKCLDSSPHCPRAKTERRRVFYLGSAQEIFQQVIVEDFRPRLEGWGLELLSLPTHSITLLRYVISISSSLAVINLAPVYALDGQMALTALFMAIAPGVPYRVVRFILGLGSGLLVVSVASSFALLIFGG